MRTAPRASAPSRATISTQSVPVLAKRPLRATAWRQVVLLCGGVLALAGLLLVWAVDPAEAGFYPPCWLHRLTGWHCPGCGATRALHALLHGDVSQALAFNPVFVVLLPIVGAALGWRGLESWRGRPPRTRPLLPGGAILALAAVLVVFGIARNLPGWPFELLAPHRLAERN
ncbi:MAG: DUF2752 domain-containing protein [Pirellulales bacterium]|nr:DUF2752 domain-containing protein [Pirellulales bacterium]